MKKNSKIHIITAVYLLIIFSNYLRAQVIIVNGVRNFTIDNNTIIRKDGVIISEIIGTGGIINEIIGTGGYKIRFRIAEDVNTTISQGTFAEIDLISDIKGPVTALNPLTILDQKVFVTADTVLNNLVSVNDLVIGDIVSVSGVINEADNSMQLSRLELNNALTEWKLRGFARNIAVADFTIGDLLINNNAHIPSNCGGPVLENTFVEVKATVDASYVAGNPLTTLTSIECQTPDVNQAPNNTIPVVVEAMVSEIIDLSSFRVNDLVVFFDGNTEFDNGEAEHIDLGTKLEIQGFLDTNTRFITATTIRFLQHRVKLVAPVLPADVAIGNSITIFGQQVTMTPQTRDDDAIISAGIAAERQIEVRGFADSSGNIYALRVKDKGTPDSQDVKLRGDITAINQPIITVNGINIDTTLSQFELATGQTDSATFFSMIQVDMQVHLDEGSYDAVNQVLGSGTIVLDEEELEDDPNNPPILLQNKSNVPIISEIIGTGGVGIATVTRIEIIEQIFAAGFE